MRQSDEDGMILRQTKVRVSWVLLNDVATSCNHRWAERLHYAVEWLQGIEYEMEMDFEKKRNKQ